MFLSKGWFLTLVIVTLFGLYGLWPFLNRSNSTKEFVQQRPSLVFVILYHLRHEEDLYLRERSYNSIREFYPDAPVVMIDDNSKIFIPTKSLLNTTYIRSEYPGAGELLPYYYFLKYRWADKMIFLHDSMFLKRPFYERELSGNIKFHWNIDYHHFDDDPLINTLLSHLKHSRELIDFNLNQKEMWYGCFGCASIIDLRLLEEIEKKYSLTHSLKNIINTRNQRCALERIFGMIFVKEKSVDWMHCSNFGSIRYYPHAFSQLDDEKLKELKQFYPGAVIKTWHGR